MSVSRRHAAWPIGLVFTAVAFLSSAFLFGTPLDDEEFRFSVLSAWLRIQGLAAGGYPYWSSGMGFGVPQPFIPHFGLHPLAPLLSVLSPITWVRILLFAHTIAGATGMWLVCRRLKLAAEVSAVCVVTYLLSAAVQNYVLEDFWPSHFVLWTSMPWILLVTWRILEDRPRPSWRPGLALGLLAGLMIANTNPGHAGVYAALAIGIMATSFGAIRRQWIAIALAVIVAAAIAAPNLAHLAGERRFFNPDLGLSNVSDPLPLSSAWRALGAPFSEREGPRTLLFGAPFFVLASIGCIQFARARLDLVLAIAVAAVMLFTDWVPASVFSTRYQFRDPLTLSAILLAGCVADRWWSRRSIRPVAAAVLLAQLFVVTATVWPYIRRTWGSPGRGAVTFRGATGEAQLSDGLVAAMRPHNRLLYSPGVDHAVAERQLVDEGLGLNALAYRGQAVINGSFKGVSTDALWPNDRLFYGWLRTPQALIDSDSSLDVLGIRHVLAFRGEHTAAGLREVWSGKTRREAELVLFENADARPGAFLIDPARIPKELPLFPACGHDRLLCRDVGSLLTTRDRDVTAIERSANEIRIAWPPSTEPRMLVVTEMYRPEWIAAIGSQTLPARALFGGFIGVVVPPGVSSARLRYRPRVIVAASLTCCATIVLALAALTFSSRGLKPSRYWEATDCEALRER